MNPHGWPEFIFITEYMPSGNSHTGDLMDIGGMFCVARWAMPPETPNQTSVEGTASWLVGAGVPWIPSMKKWDHVCSHPPSNVRVPYTDRLWEGFEELAKTVEKFEAGVRKALIRRACPLDVLCRLTHFTREIEEM
jgi:hypothetical protein